MSILGHLQPTLVWQYFEEITKVPRPSKNEGKMIDFLLDFARRHNLEAKRDKIGNVLIKKGATPGMEGRKSVLLQSHIDMVCEATKTTHIDFNNDGITPYVDGEWVRARGTTLGADDGMGIAAEMAILTDESIEHGPIECLFTVDEETGLTGAFEIQPGFFESKILLNLDSEDEGEMFIGCAGGIDTVGTMKYKHDDVDKSHKAFRFAVGGLTGGHSGDDIHKGFGNANKIANRFLHDLDRKFKVRLHTFDGGNKRNAIARDAEFVFTIKANCVSDMKHLFDTFAADIKTEFAVTEPAITFELAEVDLPAFVIDKKTQRRLINCIYACPHGVHAWSQVVKGLVETSNNLASVKFDDKKITITTSQRSSSTSGKKDINMMVKSVFDLAGAKSKSSDGYPGWAPNTNSEILKLAVETYDQLFGKKPVVRAIHAGLECGLFLEKYPDLDMISFGPTLRGVHSPDEKVEIKTVQMWFNHLLLILKNIPEK